MTPASRIVAAVVPAAGAARRFGSQKLVADMAGEPLLQHTLRSLLDGGVAHIILVTPPRHDLQSVSLVHDPRVSLATNVDPDRGMFSSIQAGLAEVPPGAALLVLPADMPFVRPSTVEALIARHQSAGAAVVAAYRGTRGHPLLLPAATRAALLDAPPETTLKAALADLRMAIEEMDVDDAGVLRDVDVRGDLE